MKNTREINIAFTMLKSSIIVYRIMPYPKSTLSGEIQMVKFMHSDAVTSGGDRGSGITS